MTSSTTEYDEIVPVIQLYIGGASKGDVGKLKEAFHADSRMFGAAGDTRYDMPIAEFFDWPLRCRATPETTRAGSRR